MTGTPADYWGAGGSTGGLAYGDDWLSLLSARGYKGWPGHDALFDRDGPFASNERLFSCPPFSPGPDSAHRPWGRFVMRSLLPSLRWE